MREVILSLFVLLFFSGACLGSSDAVGTEKYDRMLDNISNYQAKAVRFLGEIGKKENELRELATRTQFSAMDLYYISTILDDAFLSYHDVMLLLDRSVYVEAVVSVARSGKKVDVVDFEKVHRMSLLLKERAAGIKSCADNIKESSVRSIASDISILVDGGASDARSILGETDLAGFEQGIGEYPKMRASLEFYKKLLNLNSKVIYISDYFQNKYLKNNVDEESVFKLMRGREIVKSLSVQELMVQGIVYLCGVHDLMQEYRETSSKDISPDFIQRLLAEREKNIKVASASFIEACNKNDFPDLASRCESIVAVLAQLERQRAVLLQGFN